MSSMIVHSFFRLLDSIPHMPLTAMCDQAKIASPTNG
ncbi:hypothetical protein T11_11130 [Trichinella zimbabwensis]|uniref:Uncharacterized protein n=1 Tax=Trichinella zimbabwensis TaxID=268475 RepID=A0A0V1GEW6_9BILA|nr:hypothetical protein T11_11130 [Trichinella zimbabwensis]